MTAGDWRRAVTASLFSVLAVGVACAQEPPPGSIRVALGLERARTGDPGAHLVAGRTLGVVCFEASPPRTVTVADAGAMVDAFRAGLATGELPFVTEPQRLTLPTVPARNGEACDITLFDDVDANGAWAPGESFYSAWSGGRGSYRLVAFLDPHPDLAGAQAGWNLVEGGHPPTYHSVSAEVVVIEPIVEPIEGR